ncbi:MAG: ABC transporter permease [Candidatus Promineifilaceae bacterium]
MLSRIDFPTTVDRSKHDRTLLQKTATILSVTSGKVDSLVGNRIRTGKLFSAVLYLTAALFAVLVLIVPLYLIVRTGTAWNEALKTLTRPATLRVIGNTLTLTVSVTLASTCLAVPLAWLTTRSDLPGRKVWSVLHALPLVMPSYIYAFLFLSFLSPKGLAQQGLEVLFGVEKLPPIYGFTGAFIVLTLISYPYIYMTVQAALRQMDPTLLEVAQTYGASKRQILQYVLLPYLWPSITSGGLLVSLYVLRDFGAVTLLQYSTFTRVIYNRYQSYRLDEAATMATVLVIMTGIIMLLESRWRSAENDAPNEIDDTACLKKFRLQNWRWPAIIFSTGVSFFSLLMPVAILIYWFIRGMRQDWIVQGVSEIQQNTSTFADILAPARTSVMTALIAAVIGALLAIPIAILSTRYKGWWASLFERISYASFALPGIVVALAFVYTGINFVKPLYQTIPMLLGAYMVLFVPQAISAERSTMTRIPVELEEVGYSLGGSRLAIFRYVTLPLLRPGIIVGATLIFLTVMKELPATLLLSPLGYQTLPTQIWTNISEAFFARAAVPTLLLLLLSSLPLAWISHRDGQAADAS